MSDFIFSVLLPSKKVTSSLLQKTGLSPVVRLLLVLLPQDINTYIYISDEYYYLNVIERSARKLDDTTLIMKHLIYCGVLWHLLLMDYPETRCFD